VRKDLKLSRAKKNNDRVVRLMKQKLKFFEVSLVRDDTYPIKMAEKA